MHTSALNTRMLKQTIGFETSFFEDIALEKYPRKDIAKLLNMDLHLVLR
jgi:hypothetical protein